MRKFVIVTLLLGLFFFMFPAQETKAMDPISISLLAPIAMQGAAIAAPYMPRGLQSAGYGCVMAGKSFLEIFLLPIGLGEMSFGAPFGLFAQGARHSFKGLIAPFKFCFYTVTIPVRFCAGGAL